MERQRKLSSIELMNPELRDLYPLV